MIVDFSKTNPLGWDDVKVHNIPSTSLTVYETHVADVTSHISWGGSLENAKLFKGLYETGTTYTAGNITVSTGFDHIKNLGYYTRANGILAGCTVKEYNGEYLFLPYVPGRFLHARLLRL